MKSFINWLSKPYFFNPSPKTHFALAFGVGFFIFIFLYLFQPFGMPDLDNNLFYYCLGFGLVTFFTQAFMFVILPLLFKDFFKNEKWTIGKNILFLLILVTCIAFFNWLYNTQIQNTKNWRLLTIKEIFSYTFSISIFPVFIFTYFSEKFYRLKREKTSKKIMNFRVTTPIKKLNEEVKIFGDNNKENITFNIDNLVYVASQGNYVSFFMQSNNGLKEKVIRNTLSTVNSNLSMYSSIIRCHKSYIINSKFIDSITGNARGYFLESKLIEKRIPVSRKINKEELKNLVQ
jgi:hypothetical protein